LDCSGHDQGWTSLVQLRVYSVKINPFWIGVY
jgi:hypothetical protein